MMISAKHILLIGLLIPLWGCSYNYGHGGRYEIAKDGPDPSSNKNPNSVKNAVPKWEPKSKYGNPRSYEVFGKRYYVLPSSEGYKQRGIASWYGKKFHGKRTSSGEAYDMYAMTAAHKSLPLPTYVKVTNLRNGKQVILKINDRGPFHDNRLIDLSYTAAHQLGIIAKGTGLVEVEAINPSRWQAQKNVPQASSKSPVKPSKTIPKNYSAQIFIQVGAFASSYNAQKLLSKLRTNYSKQTFISNKVVNGKHFSRVRMGPLDSVEQADRLAMQLLNSGYGATRIVVE